MLNVYSFSKLFWSMHKEFLRICSQYTMKPIEQCWWSELEYKFDIYELFRYHTYKKGFPHSSVSKESACNAGYLGLIPELEISPEVWRRKWQSTPIFLRGESHGQKSLAGYSLWGRRVRHGWVVTEWEWRIMIIKAEGAKQADTPLALIRSIEI